MKYVTRILAALILVGVALGQSPAPPEGISRTSGRFIASNYAYGVTPITAGALKVSAGNSATGAQTITLTHGAIALGDGRTIYPLQSNAPITIDVGANAETVTPSAVSGCTSTVDYALTCSVTATFNNLHSAGTPITSGTAGLQEAINDAFLSGGGIVVVDTFWGTIGGTNTILAAAVPYVGVSVEDTRTAQLQYWNVQQTASTFLAVPTVLSASTAVPSATPVGAFGTGTYFMCVAYVDVAGQEGACSTTFSQAGLATGSFIFSAPAASTGAVGYTIYISLTGGTYSLAYQVPLTSSVCTLTKVETVTPACAVTNTTYGQTGATATVTAITVNTSPVDMQLGGVSGTLLTGNPNGRTTYGYVPSSHLAANGMPTINLPFTAGGIGSATPISIGTVNIPGGILNFVGKEIRVCGKFINTDVNSTVQNINIYYDAAGSNVAGSPVQIASLSANAGTGTAATYTGNFCWTGDTSVSGSGATAGSIFGDYSFLDYYLSATPGNAFPQVGGDTKTAAVGSINLNGTAGFSNRISIVHTNTTGNNTPTLQNLTLEVL